VFPFLAQVEVGTSPERAKEGSELRDCCVGVHPSGPISTNSGVAEEPDPASCISSSALLAGKSSNTSTLPSYTMVRGAFGLETKYAYSPSSNPTYEALISAVGNIKGEAIYSIYREVASRS
jgi:hypothetical protein